MATTKRHSESIVWKYFELLENKDMGKCKRCNAVLKCTGGSTSGLLRHLRSTHKNIFSETKDFDIEASPSKKSSRTTSLSKRKITKSTKISPENIEELVKLVAMDGLSMNAITNSEFIRKSQDRGTILPKKMHHLLEILRHKYDQTSPQSPSQIQTFENRHDKNDHENLEEKSILYNDEACSNQDSVLGHNTDDEHATENEDQASESSVKVEDDSIEFECSKTDDSFEVESKYGYEYFKCEPSYNPGFQNEEVNSTNIISSSDCGVSTEQPVPDSAGVLHSSTEQPEFPEAILHDSVAVVYNSEADEEADSAFCSYILKEMRCIRNVNKKRLLKMKIVSEIMNAQQDST